MKTTRNRRNTCKRVLSILTALSMSLSMFQSVAFASGNPDGGGPNTDVNIVGLDENPSAPGDADASTPGDGIAPAEGDGTNEDGTTQEPSADGEAWDITQTERPGATDDVTFDKGTSEDKNNEEKTWDIFYDADNDVYKVTLNIGSDAEATEQVIDLTQALELLNQYAQTGKQELEDAIAKLEKPVKGEPDMEKPTAPGAPENLDQNLDAAYDDILATVPRDEEGEPQEDFDYAGVIADKTGLSKDDPFVRESASRMYDQAMVDWVMDSWDKWEAEGHMYASYFGDPDTMLYYGCGISVKWPEGTNQGTPVLKGEAPKFEVDTTTPEYLEYLDAMVEYEKALAEAEAKYADDKAAYDKAVADLKAEFDRRVGADVLEPGDVKKFELYLTSDSKHTYKYQDGSFVLATPEWGSFMQGLKDLWENDPEEYARRYKTPSGKWMFDPNNLGTSNIKGFDGQILPDEYVDDHEYHVTQRCDAIYDLLTNVAGYDDYDAKNRGLSAYATNAIKKYFRETYDTDDVTEAMNAYILDYYNAKEGASYATIDELVKGSEYARSELTKTETSGNKWFCIDGKNFLVDAHLETVKYDQFYKQLFSFAFGDDENGVAGLTDENGNPISMTEFLGEMKFNAETNRWEYGNKSWTDNGYQMALYYFMDHKEVWEKTDEYFQKLLKEGLNSEQATWTSFMMALNIDGELTGNDWQNTQWPWYNSIKLERTDYDFELVKTDENGEPIKSNATAFQLWYVNGDGEKVYFTQNEDGEFVETTDSNAVVKTNEEGKLSSLYTLMKDKIYYLQEAEAPDGYVIDPTVYVLTDSADKIDEEKLRAEANAKKEALEKDLNTLLESAPDYAASSEKFQELKEKIDAYLAADGKTGTDTAAYADELQAQLNALKANDMSIGELSAALGSTKDQVQADIDAFEAKREELSNLYNSASSRIDALNSSLQAEYDAFNAVKARYEASTDPAERAALRDQMTASQLEAQRLTAEMNAVKSAYDSSSLHTEYAALQAAAQGSLSSYNGYKSALDSITSTQEYQDLKERLEALQALKDAKAEMDGHASAEEIAKLEKQIALEANRAFKLIGELTEKKDASWMEDLSLTFNFANAKELEEDSFQVRLPDEFDSLSMSGSFNSPLPDGMEFTFDVPDPDPDPTPDPDPDPDPSPDPDPDPDPTPDPDPDPVTPIPDPPVPLTPTPDTTNSQLPPPNAPNTPDVPDTTPIPDVDVPLADVPEVEEPAEELVEIPEEEVPLGNPDVPKTGDISGVWYTMTLLSAAGAVLVTILERKKREETQKN